MQGENRKEKGRLSLRVVGRLLVESLVETWDRTWFPLLVLTFVLSLYPFWKVAWQIAGEPVSQTGHRLGQMQILISMLQAVIGSGAVVSAIHGNRTSARMARQAADKDRAAERSARIGRVNAFVGSAIEAAAQAGVLAKFQHLGLNTWRKWFPDNPAERQLAVSTWNRLTDAVAATSKALERLRYDDDELLPPAEALFDIVVRMPEMASRGEFDRLLVAAGEVRDHANELQQIAR